MRRVTPILICKKGLESKRERRDKPRGEVGAATEKSRGTTEGSQREQRHNLFFGGPRRFQQAGDPVCGVVLTNCQVFRRKARANVIGRRLQARQAAVLVFLPVFVWAAIGAR